LHAVAVVKSGVFGVVRIVQDVYGYEFSTELGLRGPLVSLASVTIVYGSLRALHQDDLKRRLAFSTVSQVSYITLGAALAGPVATIGGLVHLVHQGIMKITLFFCAGNLAETLGIHRVSEMDGCGRRMPWTMAAFTIAAFGMIGVPPLAGFVTKWYLGVGAIAAGQEWVLWVLVASALLNAAYFLPILRIAWFAEARRERPVAAPRRGLETSWWLLLPPVALGRAHRGAGVRAVSGVAHLLVMLMTPLAPLALGLTVLLAPSSRALQAAAVLAPLPALATSVAMPSGIGATLPWLLEGSEFGLDPIGRTFLLAASAIWLAAALFAVGAPPEHARGRFFAFFLFAMAGNLGLIVAQDMLAFYLFFSLMSFSAYGLVVHDGSRAARRAGSVYIALVVAGDMMLYA